MSFNPEYGFFPWLATIAYMLEKQFARSKPTLRIGVPTLIKA
jgi:hypothetical protein